MIRLLLDFKERYQGHETMDDPQFSGPELFRALQHLKYINRHFGNYDAVRRAVDQVIVHNPGTESLHIVDLGCGGGDLMCYLDGYLRNKGIEVKFTGIEINAHIIKRAGDRACRNLKVEFIEADVLAPDFEIPNCDILMASHFIYHFTHDGLQEFVKRNLHHVKLAYVFSELRRSRRSYWLFKIFGPVVFPGRITILDGLIAIRRAFTIREMHNVFAPIAPQAHIERRPLFRQLITLRVKP